MLYFNFDKFDFWKIYDSIKYFYPIGIKKDESRMHRSYQGLKELESIIVDNIHNDKNLNVRWTDFTKEIETLTGKEVIGTTFGQDHTFSSLVRLHTDSMDNLVRTKDLHFFVSLLGPYYTIIGQDSNTVKIGDGYCISTNYLVISSENEYAATFILLCDEIDKRFKGYRFVPFGIGRQTIDGLAAVWHSDDNFSTIFQALFHDRVDLNVATFGNEYFKSENWVKEGYVDDGSGWTFYPPAERDALE